MDKSGCKLGMKIRRTESFNDLDKGVYTIRCFQGEDAVSLNEVPGVYLLKNFEFTNQFEVGDEVLYKIGHNYEKVEYRGENSKGEPIIEFESGSVTRAKRNHLLEIKNKGNLEVGDKFKAMDSKFKAMDSTFEVVAVGEDSELGTVYFSKSLGMKTLYYIICWEKIDKIIY